MIRTLIRVDLINRYVNGIINTTRYFYGHRTELTGTKRFKLKRICEEVNTQGCLVMLVQRFVNLRCISTHLRTTTIFIPFLSYMPRKYAYIGRKETHGDKQAFCLVTQRTRARPEGSSSIGTNDIYRAGKSEVWSNPKGGPRASVPLDK